MTKSHYESVTPLIALFANKLDHNCMTVAFCRRTLSQNWYRFSLTFNIPSFVTWWYFWRILVSFVANYGSFLYCHMHSVCSDYIMLHKIFIKINPDYCFNMILSCVHCLLCWSLWYVTTQWWIYIGIMCLMLITLLRYKVAWTSRTFKVTSFVFFIVGTDSMPSPVVLATTPVHFYQ